MKNIIYGVLNVHRTLSKHELQVKFNLIYLLATISATHGTSVLVSINGLDDPISWTIIAVVFAVIVTGFYFRAELLNTLIKITQEKT